ncbi:MAG: TonB-dependent receptor, partial [Candidatus Omnitrophica bacterium]|nr:TonB-dependent receptor [Candidatus Omnitrophota bacterium]
VVSGFNSFRRHLSKADYVSMGSSAVNNLDSYEFQPKVSWTRPLTEWLTSKLTTGLDFLKGNNDIKNVNPGGSWPFWKYATVTKKSLDVYIIENLSAWDKLLLNMGFRGGWAQYRFDQTGDTTNLDTASMRNASFDFGLGYKLFEKTLAYFDISRSFRMPATDEFYSTFGSGLNVGLKQQQEMDYELGLRDNTFKPLNVSMNLFLADIKDEIFYDPSAGGGFGANANYESPTRRYGFEMESSLKLFEKRWFNITPFFNLTTQKPYFKGGTYSGKHVPMVPDFKYATGYTLEPLKGLTISTELNHLGHQFAINDQKNVLPKLKSYAVVDMKVRYNWRWATAWISLTNLFNKKYSEYSVDNYVGGADYYPAQGRNVVTGFSLEY